MLKITTKQLLDAPILFVLVALIFGLLFVKFVPPLWGLDETAHFGRAYQIAGGNLIPAMNADGVYAGNVPKTLIDLRNYTKNDLLDNKQTGFFSRHDVDSEKMYLNLTSKHFSQAQSAYPDAAPYSPVSYVPPVAGIMVGKIFNANIGETIFLARLFSLIAYILLVWLALKSINHLRLKWLIFMVALMPVCAFQASVVTADNLAIGLSILFIALLIRSLQSDPEYIKRKIIPYLLIVAILLPLIKINYIFLSLGIVLIPLKNISISRLKARLIISSSILIMTILGVLWPMIANATANTKVSPRPDGLKVVPVDQIHFVASHPISFVEILIRTLIENGDYYFRSLSSIISWNYVALPLVVTFVLYSLIFVAAIYGIEDIIQIRKKILYLFGSIIIGTVSIFGALYITFTPTGFPMIDGVQGRYFIPFMIPIVIGLAILLPLRVKIHQALVPKIFGITSIICLSIGLFYFAAITY